MNAPTATLRPSFADAAIDAMRRDALRRRPRGEEARDDAGHREVRIRDADPARRVAREIVRDEHGRGAACVSSCGAYFGLERKLMLPLRRLGQRRDARDRDVRAVVAAGDEAHDFGERDGGHGGGGL